MSEQLLETLRELHHGQGFGRHHRIFFENILITGGSGYLGVSPLAELKSTDQGAHGAIYALVRSDEQAEYVKTHYNATPITFDLKDQAAITSTLLEKQISVVFHLISAVSADSQEKLIQRLGKVKGKLGIETHFLHTSGAKIFSSFASHPTDRVLSDMDDGLHEIQKSVNPRIPLFKQFKTVGANNKIIAAGEKYGVKTYIFMPCKVYGKGAGFGNRISVQNVAIVKAAKAMRRVCKVDNLEATWPVCHIHDNTALYIAIFEKILREEEIDDGRKGYYLTSPGSVAWTDLYKQMAKALVKRGVIDDDTVHEVSDESLEEAGKALGCPKAVVPVQMGGACSLKADRGKKIGWAPRYSAQHILDDADHEVELILDNI